MEVSVFRVTAAGENFEYEFTGEYEADGGKV
jgi:hypothetical protein